MNIFKKIFKYLEPMWLGDDNKVSLRSTAAIALIINFIINVQHACASGLNILKVILKDKQVDAASIAAMGSNMAQIGIILGVECALIAALLGLKTYQNTVIAAAGQSCLPGNTTTEAGA